MATLPYYQTSLFLSSNQQNLLYILQPADGSSNFKITSVNTSNSLIASDLSATTIGDSAPFAGENNPVTTVLTSDEKLFAYAGQCQAGANQAQIWTFDLADTGGQATWKELGLNTQGLPNSGTAGGAMFLANGMAFTSSPDAKDNIYLFGGMCPNISDPTIDDWQLNARYSNSMIALEASESSDRYDVSSVFSSARPIAEAGFSVTPLNPSYSNSSDGDVSTQQSFVLIGGQTQTAFINMSQAALFSLPQRSWSFIPIEDPDSSSGTELARREVEVVDPRSGHTATLTEDGDKVVVYGGWVGDVTSPANPQLAVLEVGDGYGGPGQWKWKVPSQQGAPPSSSGLYGHGATMLPGNVLMIVGGYKMEGSSSKLFRRQQPSASGSTYFFNMSSNSWITEYSNPTASGSESQSGDSDRGRKIGLGVGLGVGLALLIATTALLVFCWRKRKADSRSIEEKDLQGLSLGDQRVLSPALGYNGSRARSPENYPWAPTVAETEQPNYGRGSEAERTGLLVEIPSPTRGLRRSLHSRPSHWPDDGRRSRGSGNIHVIDERDEYEAIGLGDQELDQHDMMQLDRTNILATAPILDPFRDPSERNSYHERHLLDGSRSPSPQSPSPARSGTSKVEREQEMAGWEHDWAAAASPQVHKPAAVAGHPSAGRNSPDRSDRTSSTLSNNSSHSMVSALSFQPGDNYSSSGSGYVSRSISQRSALFSSRPLSSTPGTGIDRLNSTGPPSPSLPTARPQSLAATRQNRSQDGTTNNSSFPKLQTEGQALLGGSPQNGPGSPSKTRPKSWNVLGSVRRALGGGTSPTTSAAAPSFSLLKRKPLPSEPGSSTSADAGLGMPKRSMSTGTTLFRRQQGARDWDAEPPQGVTQRMSMAGRSSPGTLGSMGDDGDWDVESAVERRVVQLMFTVPKEKLRVVNAGPDGDGVSLLSTDDLGPGLDDREVSELDEDEQRLYNERAKGKGKMELPELDLGKDFMDHDEGDLGTAGSSSNSPRGKVKTRAAEIDQLERIVSGRALES